MGSFFGGHAGVGIYIYAFYDTLSPTTEDAAAATLKADVTVPIDGYALFANGNLYRKTLSGAVYCGNLAIHSIDGVFTEEKKQSDNYDSSTVQSLLTGGLYFNYTEQNK